MIRRPTQGGVPRRNAMQRICILVAVVAGCIVLGAGWWFVAMRDVSTLREPESEALEETALERAALAELVAQVAADGGSRSDPPPVQAAPRRFPNGPAGRRAETSSPSPPDGYAFVTHHGEIRTHRVERSPVAVDGADDGLDWLDAVDSVQRLVAQAEAAKPGLVLRVDPSGTGVAPGRCRNDPGGPRSRRGGLGGRPASSPTAGRTVAPGCHRGVCRRWSAWVRSL